MAFGRTSPGPGGGVSTSASRSPRATAIRFCNMLYPDRRSAIHRGRIAGARRASDHVAPKIFFTNGSYEYWGRAASLIHTTPDGKTDVPPDANDPDLLLRRVAAWPRNDSAAQGGSAESGRRQRLSLLRSARCCSTMQAWLKDGMEPPAVRVSPDLEGSTGGAGGAGVSAHRRRACAHTSSAKPTGWTSAPSRRSSAILIRPWCRKWTRTATRPAGIRMPEIRVPLAPYTGWNLRSTAIGAPDEM